MEVALGGCLAKLCDKHFTSPFLFEPTFGNVQF